MGTIDRADPLSDDLFGATDTLPAGMRYQAGFLTTDEETSLLQTIQSLPLQEAQYKQFTARRRIISFGGRYDFSNLELLPATAVPEWLYPLRHRAASWAGLAADDIHHALIAEYRPGTPLGWHRDVPDFEAIVGVSLAGSCRLRLRRYPPRSPARAQLHLDLAPRSIYTLQGDARWQWQHSVSPTRQLRYSITFRTLRKPAAGAKGRP